MTKRAGTEPAPVAPVDAVPLWSAVHVRAYRLAAGWTQDELAERSGVARLSISNIEAGAVGAAARPATVARLAAALGVPTWRCWVLPRGVTGFPDGTAARAADGHPDPRESDEQALLAGFPADTSPASIREAVARLRALIVEWVRRTPGAAGDGERVLGWALAFAGLPPTVTDKEASALADDELHAPRRGE